MTPSFETHYYACAEQPVIAAPLGSDWLWESYVVYPAGTSGRDIEYKEEQRVTNLESNQ